MVRILIRFAGAIFSAQVAFFVFAVIFGASVELAAIGSVFGVLPAILALELRRRAAMTAAAVALVVQCSVAYLLAGLSGFRPMPATVATFIGGAGAFLASAVTGPAISQPVTHRRILLYVAWLWLTLSPALWFGRGLKLYRLPGEDSLAITRIIRHGDTWLYVHGGDSLVRVEFDLDDDRAPDCREEVFRRPNRSLVLVLRRDQFGWSPDFGSSACASGGFQSFRPLSEEHAGREVVRY